MSLSKGLIKGASLRASTVLRPSLAQQAPPVAAAQRQAIPPVAPVQPLAGAGAPSTHPAPSAPAPDPAELARLKEAARLEGRAQGLQQGRAEAEKALQGQLGEMSRLMEAIQQAHHEHCSRQEALLADFAFVAVNRLLGDALQDRAMAVASVRAALLASQPWQEATLELHPHDLETVRQALGDQPGLRCVASTAVSLGGCRVATSEGTLDARLEVQLAELHERLQAARDAG